MSQCDNCPAEGCEGCPEVKINDESCSVESHEFSDSNASSLNVNESADFIPTPPIVTAINALGQSAQAIHAAAKDLHPGDAGIMVSMAVQIGAVAQMFIDAVEASQAQAQEATQVESAE